MKADSRFFRGFVQKKGSGDLSKGNRSVIGGNVRFDLSGPVFACYIFSIQNNSIHRKHPTGVPRQENKTFDSKKIAPKIDPVAPLPDPKIY
jgi:hypothetical protein